MPELAAEDMWTLGALKALKPAELDPLVKLADADRDKVVGTDERIALYSRRGGGRPFHAKRDTDGTLPEFWGPGYKAKGSYSRTAKYGVGELVITLFPVLAAAKGSKKGGASGKGRPPPTDDVKMAVLPMAGVDWGGRIDNEALMATRNALRVLYASPVTLSEMDFDLEDGLSARGVIPTPSIPLLEKVQIGVLVDGDDFGLEATVTADALTLPGPFQVIGGALGVRAWGGDRPAGRRAGRLPHR